MSDPASDDREPAPAPPADVLEVLAVLQASLVTIARGRPDNGRALNGFEARDLARRALLRCNRRW